MPGGSGRTGPSARRGLLAAMTLVLAACTGAPLSGNAVTIKAIRADPRAYVDSRVVIEGEVTATMSLVLVRYFTLDDGTGSMNVVTDRTLPAKGQRMRVAGKVSDLFSFGSESMLVLVEEQGESVGAGAQRTAQP